MEAKIFEFSHFGGEKDWVVALDIEDAKKGYNYTTGDDETFEDIKIRELSSDEVAENKITDSNDYDPDRDDDDEYDGGYRIIGTFQTEIDTYVHSYLFCSNYE